MNSQAMKKYLLVLLLVSSFWVNGQDLSVSVPLVSLPQNLKKYPSMQQSMGISTSMYEFSFFGLHSLGGKWMGSAPNWQRQSLEYVVGFAFSQYGSELPIPLGVWGHEEYHRSVLSTANIHSFNGNWLLHRWDGTVYGPSDEELSELKANDLDVLLYSYVSGVQYETQLTKKMVIQDFHNASKNWKAPLYLYNAFYVWNYFKLATSTLSDSVKVIAPQYESSSPDQRDFAGLDLTAWAYDMFSPDQPYTNRDDFPNGEGVNRRVGFHDLSIEAQHYLKKQKKLSLLNFINPAIFLINKIRVNEHLEVLPFVVYQPTHFGNAISLQMPFQYDDQGYLLGLTRFSNYHTSSYGVDLGVMNRPVAGVDEFSMSCVFHLWKQPASFYSHKSRWGGALDVIFKYRLSENFGLNMDCSVKSAGWQEGNPYLDRKINVQFGIDYSVRTLKF